MVIFLYGPDSYRSKRKLDEIVNHYKELRKSALNLIYVDAGQTDFADFYNHFKISPMFAEKKLVVVKNLFSSKEFQENFLEKMKILESLKDVIIIYEGEVPDQRLKIFKVLTKECKSQEFKLLDGKNLKTWTQKEFEQYGTKINMDALDLLLSYAGNDLWRLSSEIKKLSDFSAKGGPASGWKNGVINKQNIELLVRPNIEIEIFKTIDAIAEKNKRQSLGFLQKHLEAGDSPLYVLSMVAFQFKNLLVVKELAQKGLMYASIMKKSGLHPFVVKKTYFMCSQFSFEELKAIYRKIFQVDWAIKTGRIEPETALDLLVSQI